MDTVLVASELLLTLVTLVIVYLMLVQSCQTGASRRQSHVHSLSPACSLALTRYLVSEAESVVAALS